MYNQLLAGLTEHDTGRTPREVIHTPERVDRKHEREDRNGENIEHHPSNHVPFASKDEHESLKTIHGTDHDEGNDRNSLAFADNRHDQVNDLFH